MNRMLIIAICGLILALIIGATTQTRVKESSQEIYRYYDDKKCSDEVELKEGECFRYHVGQKPVHAEIFLRSLKRKPRMLYAWSVF